jgi:hypothetical protein
MQRNDWLTVLGTEQMSRQFDVRQAQANFFNGMTHAPVL